MNIFFEPFAIRAFIAAGVAGVAAPVIGAFLVQRRLALIGDGIGHLAFAGVALGIGLGIAPLWGALLVAVLGAVALERLRRGGRLASDMSGSYLLRRHLEWTRRLVALEPVDASAIGVLFGSILTASVGDVIGIVILSAAVVACVVIFYRPLLAVALDEETARASGQPVDALNLLIVTLTALLVAAGMRAVGLLLVSALLVVPVAAGARLSHSFRATVVWGGILGGVSAVGGLAVALTQGRVAPGGTIVLTSLGIFGVASVIGRRAARKHPRVAR